MNMQVEIWMDRQLVRQEDRDVSRQMERLAKCQVELQLVGQVESQVDRLKTKPRDLKPNRVKGKAMCSCQCQK